MLLSSLEHRDNYFSYTTFYINIYNRKRKVSDIKVTVYSLKALKFLVVTFSEEIFVAFWVKLYLLPFKTIGIKQVHIIVVLV